MPIDTRQVVADIAELVRIPSVSSTDPELDLSNGEVIERLAGMLESAGFRTECLPVRGQSGTFNLIASKGNGPGFETSVYRPSL